MTLTEELKRRMELAKATTPGRWEVNTVPTSIGQCHKVEPAGVCIYDDHRRGNGTERGNNATFIASLNPSVALALIECVEALAKYNALPLRSVQSIQPGGRPQRNEKALFVTGGMEECADQALSRLAKAMGCES